MHKLICIIYLFMKKMWVKESECPPILKEEVKGGK
jgi:hypothetical protein